MRKTVKELIEECKKENNTVLRLDHQKLTEIPSEIFEFTQLTNLDLSRNSIAVIPPEIKKLENLTQLWFNGNAIKDIPKEILDLKNLRSLHLSQNKIKKFPIELSAMENLRHICLRDNVIEELPPEIEQTNIKDIQLGRNKITRLPLTFSNVDFYLSLGLSNNPLVDPPIELFRVGTSLVKFLYEKEKGRVFEIPFQTELKTTFKQYLTYFGEFVKTTKGKLIGFEVRDIEEGLEIEIKTENNSDSEIAEIQAYLQEYVSFIKTQVDDIKPSFEVDLDSTNKDFVMLELRSQVRNLQTQVELQTLRNATLIEDRDRYFQLLSNMTQSQPQFNFNNQSISQNYLSQKTEFNFDMNENLPELLKHLTNLRKEIPANEEYITKELNKIDEELLEIEEDTNDSNINKTTFKKLKRILDEVNEDDSTLNKTIKGSKRAVQAIQELGKTYNKFAEWLALPQVPSVFLGK